MMLEHHHFTGWSEDFNFVVHLGANYVWGLVHTQSYSTIHGLLASLLLILSGK